MFRFAPLRALALLIAAPLILTGCFITPGKFVSTLHLGADRSFSFTYTGEFIAVDVEREMERGMRGVGPQAGSTSLSPAAFSTTPAQATVPKIETRPAPKSDSDAQFRAIAEALREEPGYRRVEYKGNGVFEIDYAVTGRLSHGFNFPYNPDATIIFPFVTVELRGRDQVRVRAPAFGDDPSASAGAMGKMLPGNNQSERPPSRVDGTFTVTTDAEILSQNTERAPQSAAGRSSMSWRVTPRSRSVPLAVVRVASLP